MSSTSNPRVRMLLVYAALILAVAGGQAQTVGERLPAWTPGTLDIHRISTGKGDAVLYVFPDRTTLLADPAASDAKGARFPEPRPDASRRPGEWIARYIAHFLPGIAETGLDYALITHFHSDHMGAYFPDAEPVAGGYQRTGITDVGDRIPIRTMLDRGWPDYSYPPGNREVVVPPQRLMFGNYRKFLDWQIAHQGMRVERFQAGRNDQVTLKREPRKYPTFEFRNIAAGGEIWTGEGNSARPLFPALDNVPPAEMPSFENMCSLVFRLRYGKFGYYAGGDIPGIAPEGKPAWRDVETPVARVTGPVDVLVLNHHGVRDTTNEFFLRTLQPRVAVVSFWAASHLESKVLGRLLSPAILPTSCDIFSTNMLESMQAANPEIAKLKSRHGHVVIRVVPGGDEYRVLILDDTAETFKVTAVHGPYPSRSR